mmetsp:Transcript_52159/g.95244  ORF Transcript_52159/g.95244 Transcript_52159/m.95244 type:complete len:211 (+) Transcript_52159:26-658(+)
MQVVINNSYTLASEAILSEDDDRLLRFPGVCFLLPASFFDEDLFCFRLGTFCGRPSAGCKKASESKARETARRTSASISSSAESMASSASNLELRCASSCLFRGVPLLRPCVSSASSDAEESSLLPLSEDADGSLRDCGSSICERRSPPLFSNRAAAAGGGLTCDAGAAAAGGFERGGAAGGGGATGGAGNAGGLRGTGDSGGGGASGSG